MVDHTRPLFSSKIADDVCASYSFEQKLISCRVHRNQKQRICTEILLASEKDMENMYQEKSVEQLQRLSVPMGECPVLYGVATLIGVVI